MSFTWAEIWSLFFLVCGGLAAAVLTLRYHGRTVRLVRTVQGISREEGKEWPFWSNLPRKSLFVFAPQRLLEPGESARLAGAKEELIRHRRNALKSFLTGAVALVLGLVLGLAGPLMAGWMGPRP